MDIHFLYNWKLLLDSKIASSPTNINGINTSSYFYLRIIFPNKHILLKAKKFFICHTVLLSSSGSIHDNISSLSITKNMQSLIF